VNGLLSCYYQNCLKGDNLGIVKLLNGLEKLLKKDNQFLSITITKNEQILLVVRITVSNKLSKVTAEIYSKEKGAKEELLEIWTYDENDYEDIETDFLNKIQSNEFNVVGSKGGKVLFIVYDEKAANFVDRRNETPVEEFFW
jgi:hypothetical protein